MEISRRGYPFFIIVDLAEEEGDHNQPYLDRITLSAVARVAPHPILTLEQIALPLVASFIYHFTTSVTLGPRSPVIPIIHTLTYQSIFAGANHKYLIQLTIM